MTITAKSGNDDLLTTNEIQLVALDVDGTLVDHDGRMSDGVREAASAVVDSGLDVIIATGRSLGATLPIIQMIGMTRGYCVCSNGAVTLRIDTSLPDGYEVLTRVCFDPAAALRALRERLPTAKYALENDKGEFLATERFQDASFGAATNVVDFERMLTASAVRVVVFSTDSTAEEFGEIVRSIGLHGVTYSVGWTAWLDIAAAGVTKASALEELRRHLEVDPSRTLAIGDGRNDIEMLGWAAQGVAMGQAPQEVMDAASAVTETVYDDGAALVLQSLLRDGWVASDNADSSSEDD